MAAAREAQPGEGRQARARWEPPRRHHLEDEVEPPGQRHDRRRRDPTADDIPRRSQRALEDLHARLASRMNPDDAILPHVLVDELAALVGDEGIPLGNWETSLSAVQQVAPGLGEYVAGADAPAREALLRILECILTAISVGQPDLFGAGHAAGLYHRAFLLELERELRTEPARLVTTQRWAALALQARQRVREVSASHRTGDLLHAARECSACGEEAHVAYSTFTSENTAGAQAPGGGTRGRGGHPRAAPPNARRLEAAGNRGGRSGQDGGRNNGGPPPAGRDFFRGAARNQRRADRV